MAPLKHGYKVAGRVYQEVEEPNRQRNYRKGKAVMREGLPIGYPRILNTYTNLQAFGISEMRTSQR